MLADYHIHTEFSDDSEEKMETAVVRAIAAGLDEICFTDHVDYGIKLDHDEFKAMDEEEQRKFSNLLNVNYPEYIKEINRLKELYRGQICIKTGLEFGIQMHTIPRYQKLLAACPLDFVILSCHQVEDREFWNYEFQKGRTADEYNTRYYQEIYNCVCNYRDYSVLGHLDMIQRYNETRYPFEKSQAVIEKILARAIADNKGIEVNTSSFRYGLTDLMPERRILKLYHDMGGHIITIGSDAHRAGDIDEQIPYIQSELKKIGYQHFCTFERMKPVFHELAV